MTFPQRGRLRLLAFAALPFLPACSRDAGHGGDTEARVQRFVGPQQQQLERVRDRGDEGQGLRDIGCALFWLKEQQVPWADAPDTELWVADFRGGEWLDARKAHYLPGKTTPMAYGYGALAKPEAGSVDFATMKAAILARGK